MAPGGRKRSQASSLLPYARTAGEFQAIALLRPQLTNAISLSGVLSIRNPGDHTEQYETEPVHVHNMAVAWTTRDPTGRALPEERELRPVGRRERRHHVSACSGG